MNKNIDTIKINGKRFNAKTGHAYASRSIDGVLAKNVTATVLPDTRPVHKPLVSSVKKPVMDITRSPAKHAVKRQTQPGQTLMRRGLNKPTSSLKRTTKLTVANNSKGTVTIANIAIKQSAAVIDQKKTLHAQKILKSELITRFADLNTKASKALAGGRGVNLSAKASRAVVASAHDKSGLAKQPSMDIFERALAHAKSHEQKSPTKTKQRKLNVLASSLAVLVLAGFVGFQNLPTMKLQYASSRAGFKAEMPGYRPAGFSVGKLSYQAGAVNLNFHSNSDSRAFAISQKLSAWDSQALRDNYVTSSGQKYRTVDAAGRTIYLYGNNNATWVNGGVWYQVQSAGSLSERQLTDIASSM